MVLRVQKKDTGLHTGATQTGALDALVSQAMLSRAASLARKGEYAMAVGMLKELVGGENENTIALDLLARIHAQQGRFSEAEAFWKRALQLEPGNGSYLAGLKCIAHTRSRPLWTGLLLPIGATIIGVLAVWLVGFAIRVEIAQLHEALLRDVARANSAPREEMTDAVRGVPRAPQIAIQLSGATVKTQQNALVVLPDEGLFASRAELKPEAKTLLSELGKQLRPHASNFSICVVGYTDDIPVPEGWVYPGNAALGMARAVAVAEYLWNNAGLPAGLFLLQSAEESQAPYLNDTRANRLRNRTAVIRIYPGQDVAGGCP